MMSKKITMTFVLVSAALIMEAQKARIVLSTIQIWAQVACCSSGSNYHIVLASPDSVKKIEIDTVFIGNKPFVNNTEQTYTLSTYKQKGKMMYSIKIAEVVNERPLQQYPDLKEENVVFQEKRYQGQALIVYHIGKKRYQAVVRSFTEIKM